MKRKKLTRTRDDDIEHFSLLFFISDTSQTPAVQVEKEKEWIVIFLIRLGRVRRGEREGSVSFSPVKLIDI